jgi:hypothetical protein
VAGRAIAVGAAGDVVVIWDGPTRLVENANGARLVVARYDPDGHRRWAVPFADKRCGVPSFAPRVKLAPDGDVIVVAAVGIGGFACVARFTPHGQLSWVVQLAHTRGIPHLGVDAAGRSAVVGGHAWDDPSDTVAVVDPRGVVEWERRQAMRIDAAGMTPGGEVVTIGHVIDNNKYVDLDPATPAVESVMVQGIGRDGRRAWSSVVAGATTTQQLPLYVGVDGLENVYTGWRDWNGQNALVLSKLGRDRREVWSTRIASTGVVIVSGGPDGVAVAAEQRGGWELWRVSGDGMTSRPIRIGASGVDGIELGDKALAATGYTYRKRAEFGGAGTLTTRCKDSDRRRNDAGEPFDVEHCVTIGWVARYPNRARPRPIDPDTIEVR